MSFFREWLAHRRRIRMFVLWVEAVKWAERDAWIMTGRVRNADTQCYRDFFRDRVETLQHGLAGVTDSEAEAAAEQILGEMNRAIEP